MEQNPSVANVSTNQAAFTTSMCQAQTFGKLVITQQVVLHHIDAHLVNSWILETVLRVVKKTVVEVTYLQHNAVAKVSTHNEPIGP